jgi:hypothetical protein
MKRVSPPEASFPEAKNGGAVRAVDFQVVSFLDQGVVNGDGTHGREVIYLFALGDDGVVRQYADGKWVGFPIL